MVHITRAHTLSVAPFITPFTFTQFRMPPTETTSLLPQRQNGESSNGSVGQRPGFFSTDGQPNWVESYKWFIFGTYFNILLVFIPLSFAAHHLNWDVALRFSFSFLAIMPLAKVSEPYRYLSACLALSY